MKLMMPSIPRIKHIDSGNFFLIAGPCVVESEAITYQIVQIKPEENNFSYFFNTEQLANGLYMVEAYSRKSLIAKGKLSIIH